MRLQDKVAIVTGGGSGIGTAYTRRFLAEGAKVMIADIGEEQGTRTAAELASEAENKVMAPAVSAQNPPTGLSFVIREPMVRTILQPPK